jgi:hypothetical protein
MCLEGWDGRPPPSAGKGEEALPLSKGHLAFPAKPDILWVALMNVPAYRLCPNGVKWCHYR